MEEALSKISQHPDYKILTRVQTTLVSKHPSTSKIFRSTIVDLETLGMDANQHEIIEIGLLFFLFTTEDGVIGIADSYNELHDPGKTIPPEITKITGITDNHVKGKSIDWMNVERILNQTHLIICHNSGFDRNFLEIQTPSNIQLITKSRPFACTIKDINWNERGFESAKLDYLNWKLGFFYDGPCY